MGSLLVLCNFDRKGIYNTVKWWRHYNFARRKNSSLVTVGEITSQVLELNKNVWGEGVGTEYVLEGDIKSLLLTAAVPTS